MTGTPVHASTGPSAAHDSRVVVVIPNWNGEPHLRECLGSLRAQTYRGFSILLVDNGSTDDSVAIVRDEYPEVTVIETGENLGFAGAVNTGIRSSSSEFVVLLNNDTRADERWLESLVGAADDHPEAASFASLMVFYSDPAMVNAAGDQYEFGLASAVNRGMHERADAFADPAWVFGACAGASMYRRSFFDTVGVFDERYFLMHEDTDLNMRALLLGLRCLYVPTARVEHKLGASIGTMPLRSTLSLALRNQSFVAAKTLPWTLLLATLPILAWRDIRDTVPVRWAARPRLPRLLALAPLRCRSRRVGLVMGLKARREMPPRVLSIRELLRGFRARPLDGTGA